MDLSGAIKDHTQRAHSGAESSRFITELLQGRLSVDAYTALIAQYHPIYASLEQVIAQHAAHPHLAPFADPALTRTAALDADLTALVGPDWRAQTADGRLPTLSATQAYLDHLDTVASSDPLDALAHHYVRYLGDLSGGIIVARLIQRHYGVPDGALTFSRFPIESPKRYKDIYRARLDALRLTAAERAHLLAAAAHAFALNTALFDDLATTLDLAPAA